MIEYRRRYSSDRLIVAVASEDKRLDDAWHMDTISDALVLVKDIDSDAWLLKTTAIWFDNEYSLHASTPGFAIGSWSVDMQTGDLNPFGDTAPIALADYLVFREMLPAFKKLLRRRKPFGPVYRKIR